MTWENFAALIVAVPLLAYLVYSLLKAEDL